MVLGPWASMLVGVDRAADPGGIFRRRRNHHVRRELFQHGDCRLAGGAFCLPRHSGQVGDSRPRAGSAAAALAGYAAINVSALFTACELGIQPLFFKDASGAPLYAPYALHIAIPAMMLGHLTFAGLAELFVSGGVVAYLQKNKSCAAGPEAFERRADAGARFRPQRGLEDDSSALDSRGPAHASDASRNSGGRARPGGNGEREIFPIRRCGSKSRPPRATLLLRPQQPQGLARLSSLWSAPFPAVRASVRAPPRFWLRDVGRCLAAASFLVYFC